jgi:hypothetical protein
VLKQQECRLAPSLESIDGIACHVVEVPGMEKLWIDASRGVLVRRECYTGGPEATPQATYQLSAFREVEPHVWLPFRMQRKLFADQLETDIRVVRYEVNRVRDTQFSYTPGPGTLVVDRDTDEWYQVPGGLEVWDQMCTESIARIDPDVSGIISNERRLGTSVAMFALGAVFYVLAQPAFAVGRRVARR